MNDEVLSNPDEAADIKRFPATADANGLWQSNLWPDVPAAIAWANQGRLSEAGEIVFNIRDNGQVWTYTLVFS